MLTPVLFPALSQFGEIQTVNRTPIIELASCFPLSALRDEVNITGSATATTAAGEHHLATTASGTDAVTLSSAERGRYKPGYSAQIGIGVRIPTLPTGNQKGEWGYFNQNNGVYFGVDATGVFIARKSGGVEYRIERASWNVDKLDGEGPSGLTFDLARGNIFQVVFSWYGYGVHEFQVVMVDALGRQRVFAVHRLEVQGSSSLEEPNLPVSAQISNNGTAQEFHMYVGGRQFSIVGQYTPNRRTTVIKRLDVTDIGTTPLPILSFRRKSDRINVPVQLSGYDTIVTGNALIELWVNATLTGASWATPENTTANETALERDISATAISGGNVIHADLVTTSGSGSNASGDGGRNGLSLYIPESQPVTITIRSLATTITASSLVKVVEEW